VTSSLPLWAAMIVEKAEGPVTLRYDVGARNPTLAFAFALAAFDRGERGRLAELIRRGVAIPPEHCAAVAEIIEGTRKPDKRGRHSRKLTEFRKHEAVMDLLSFREQRAAFLSDAEAISEERGNVDTADVVREIHAAYAQAVADLASSYGITSSYLEKLAQPAGQ